MANFVPREHLLRPPYLHASDHFFNFVILCYAFHKESGHALRVQANLLWVTPLQVCAPTDIVHSDSVSCGFLQNMRGALMIMHTA